MSRREAPPAWPRGYQDTVDLDLIAQRRAHGDKALVQAWTESAGFPRPVRTVNGTPVWDWAEVKAWIEVLEK